MHTPALVACLSSMVAATASAAIYHVAGEAPGALLLSVRVREANDRLAAVTLWGTRAWRACRKRSTATHQGDEE